MIRLIAYSGLFFLIASCSNSNNNHNHHTTDPNAKDTVSGGNKISVNDFALEEPVKKIIYYMSEVDITTYDSIATQYFHEVLDYEDTAAIALETKISKLQSIVDSDSLSTFEKQVASDKITSLTLSLNQYKKVITGYVFVHTFLNKGDTLSAIIVTNADMSKGEAYPIHAVKDVEPTAYTNNVRKIEQ